MLRGHSFASAVTSDLLVLILLSNMYVFSWDIVLLVVGVLLNFDCCSNFKEKPFVSKKQTDKVRISIGCVLHCWLFAAFVWSSQFSFRRCVKQDSSTPPKSTTEAASHPQSGGE